MQQPTFDPERSFDDVIATIGLTHDPGLTHLSINGTAKTQYGIATSGHPFYRLKAAENTIAEKKSTLRDVVLKQRAQQRQQTVQKQQLIVWEERLAAISGEGSEVELQRLKLQQKIGDLTDELAAAKLETARLQDMIRDAQVELDAAQTEKHLLVQQHPFLNELSYEELQNRAGSEALMDRLSKVAATALLQQQGFPEQFSTMLLELAPESVELILRGALLKIGNIQPLLEHFSRNQALPSVLTQNPSGEE